MSQKMNIIRCSSCKTYQVHIVKKANKWQCKICNFKQSFRKVYFQGSGKDCRLIVQKLNLAKENEVEGLISYNNACGSNAKINDLYSNSIPEPKKFKLSDSKWAKYLDASELEADASNASNNNQNTNCEINRDTIDNYNDKNDDVAHKYLQDEPTNNNQSTSFEIDNETIDSDDDVACEYSQNELTNVDNDSSYENERNEEEFDDDITEETLDNVYDDVNEDNSQSNDFYSTKMTETKINKSGKNIFDDNEEFDLTIDF